TTFAAPGRRKLFVDYWNELQRSLRSRPAPLPAIDFSDLGIGQTEIQSLRAAGLWTVLEGTLREEGGRIPAEASGDHRRLLEAVQLWREGNAAFTKGHPDVALASFEEASRRVPAGRIYEMNAVLALAALGRWRDVDSRLMPLYGEWADDLRLPAVMAMI